MSITSTLTAIGAAGAGGEIESFIYEATYSGGDLILSAACVDSQENIIAVAKIGTTDVYVLKLDKNGTKLWDKIINSTANLSPSGYGGLSVDSSDNIYINLLDSAPSTPNRIYKLNSSGSYVRHVVVSNISTRGCIGIGSSDQVWIAGGWNGGPGMIATKFDTDLAVTHSYYFRGNDNITLNNNLNATGNSATVFAQDRDVAQGYLYRIDYSGGSPIVTQQDNYLSDFQAPVLPPLDKNYALFAATYVTYASLGVYEYVWGHRDIAGVPSQAIVGFRSTGINDPSAASIIYHADYTQNPDIKLTCVSEYGSSFGFMMGGEVLGGADGQYAFIFRNASAMNSSSNRNLLAITGAEGDNTKSIAYMPNSQKIVAALGDTGFTLIKLPTIFDPSQIAGTYNGVTFVDRTGDFIIATGNTLDNRPSGQLTVNTRVQGAASTSESTVDASGISETLTEI